MGETVIRKPLKTGSSLKFAGNFEFLSGGSKMVSVTIDSAEVPDISDCFKVKTGWCGNDGQQEQESDSGDDQSSQSSSSSSCSSSDSSEDEGQQQQDDQITKIGGLVISDRCKGGQQGKCPPKSKTCVVLPPQKDHQRPNQKTNKTCIVKG